MPGLRTQACVDVVPGFSAWMLPGGRVRQGTVIALPDPVQGVQVHIEHAADPAHGKWQQKQRRWFVLFVCDAENQKGRGQWTRAIF
jgi:hypothetical protein